MYAIRSYYDKTISQGIFNATGFMPTQAGWLNQEEAAQAGWKRDSWWGVITSYSIHYTKLYDMPYDIKQRVAGILMNRVSVVGDIKAVPITVNDFMGNMVEYNTLLSRLIQWNLADFFTWLDSVVNDVRPGQQVNPQ